MQAIKEKLNDMSTMRKVKAEAKADEQAEKELAKTRLDVAHEVRKAKEAEAQMDMHVAKAAQRIDKEIMKRTDQLGAEPMVAVTDDRQGYRSVTADGDLNQGYTGGTHTNNITNMAGADPNPNFL